MEILSYKLLNEQVVNQTNLTSLAKLNMARGAKIDRVSAANAYRNFMFQFIDRTVYKRYLRFYRVPSTMPRGGFVYATINQNFLTIYEGNACYLYPYVNQDVVKLNEDEVRSYLKIELFDANDPNQVINVKTFFETFKIDPTRLNVDNTKAYKLTIGPKFQEINRTYNIKNNISKLPSLSRNGNSFFVSFVSISNQFLVDDRYNKKETNTIAPNIEFTSQSNPTIASFFTNRVFNGTRRFNLQQGTTRSTQIPANFSHYAIFTFQNSNKYYVYTQDNINDYFNQNQFNQIKDCYIGRTSAEFIQATLKVINVN